MTNLREDLLRWRRGEPSLDEWASRKILEGELDIWLDPVLPVYVLSRPDVYLGALRQGAVSAGKAVAHDNALWGRALVRGEDDFELLARTLQERWDSDSLDLPLLADMMFPWSSPFRYYREGREFLAKITWSITMSVVDSVEFRQYTRFVFYLADALQVPSRRLWGLMSSDGEKNVYRELQEWAYDPNPPLWSSVFLQNLRDRAYGNLSDPFLAYLTDTLGLVATLVAHSPDLPLLRPKVLAEVRAQHPVCPLLRYFPAKGRLPYSEYANIEAPQLFTRRPDAQQP